MALATVGSVSCWFKSICNKLHSPQENLLLLDELLDLFDIPHDREIPSRRLLERVVSSPNWSLVKPFLVVCQLLLCGREMIEIRFCC